MLHIIHNGIHVCKGSKQQSINGKAERYISIVDIGGKGLKWNYGYLLKGIL
jgi:hypothetical protein